MIAQSAKKQLIFILTAMLSLIFLGACGGNEEVPITVPEGAQAGDLFLESCLYTVEADKVEYAADCGTLVVPENRKNPDSRLIAIPVTRIHVTGDNPAEPIFWIQGGPGHPNGYSYPADGLFENHDFVMVGYRGAEGQVVLECPELSKAISQAAGGPLDEASLDDYSAGLDRCSQRLTAEGIDLAGYTMVETIDDMETARQALGYDRINLYGNSYGSRLEMIYQWRYPDSLNRVVHVAVNPPGHFIWDPADTDALVEEYSRLCAQDEACSARTDNLAETMRQVSNDMPERWLIFPIDADAIRMISYFMFVESVLPADTPVPLYGPAAVDMWLSAAEGDASGMALASMSRNLFLPTLFTWGHFAAMGGSVNDYLDPSRDYPSELNPSNSIIGAPFSYFLWGVVRGWPSSLIDEEYFQVQPSDIETLLVSGSVDFATPPKYATEEFLPHLSNGHQVILEDIGHTESVWQSQPEARARLVNTYFDTGEVDALGYTYQPLNFTVETSWGTLAKRALGIVVVAIVLLIGVIWLAVRWILRRKSAGTLSSNDTKSVSS